MPLIVIATLVVGLPIAIGENPTTRPATSQSATSTSAPASRLSEREIELREGRRIIEETADVYKNCKSYQDEGEVITVFFHGSRKRIDRKPFNTAFFRPDRYRFEFRDPNSEPGQYIIWANKTDVRSWWYLTPIVKKHKTIRDAIPGTMGVSGGSSYTIPALLLPGDVGGGNLTHLKEIRHTDQEMTKGALYNILDAKREDGDPVRVWIDADTKLICKILEKKKFPDFRTERTTTYKPKINVDIHAEDLEFNAPKE